MSWQLASFLVLGGVLLGGFAWYERSRPPSQIVALVAALAALAVAGRVAFAPIPNVVATTDIAIFSGYALGAAPGFAVGALAGLISNFWLGQGPWTPWQMAGWGLAGVLGAVLARASRRRAGRLELAAACGFAGFAYGALLNFSLMVSYGGELTLERFGVLQTRAIPFDVAHAAGNVTLALIAGPAMVRMLARFRDRFEFRWRNAGLGEGTVGTGLLLVALAASAAALVPGPARAAPKLPAVTWLEHAQNRDGGFPATPGEESSPEMTGWAMLGLEAAGRNPLDVRTSGNSAVDYLRRNAGDLRTPGDLARTILALKGAGVDAHRFAGRDLVARLADRQRRNGSFQGWPNSTAFAVLALRGSGGGVDRALTWLRRVRNSDGGWGATPATASDPDSTGAVLQAIGEGSRATGRGIRYLRRTQKPSGGWALAEAGAVNAQSTAWAIQGLVAAGVDPAHVRQGGRTGLDYLAARIAPNGHYRYSATSDQTPVWVTGQVLAGAHLKSFPLAAVPRSPAAAPSAAGQSAPVAGGAGAPPERRVHERATAPGQPPDGRSSELREREGPGAAKTGGGAVAAAEAGGGAPADSATGDQGGGGGDSPLLPILIGVGAGGLVLGGGWLLAKRLRW